MRYATWCMITSPIPRMLDFSGNLLHECKFQTINSNSSNDKKRSAHEHNNQVNTNMKTNNSKSTTATWVWNVHYCGWTKGCGPIVSRASTSITTGGSHPPNATPSSSARYIIKQQHKHTQKTKRTDFFDCSLEFLLIIWKTKRNKTKNECRREIGSSEQS